VASTSASKSSIRTFDKFNVSSAGSYPAQFLATGGNTASVYTSPDGITWTQRTTGLPAYNTGAPHRNGSLYAVIDQGYFNRYTSADGITWAKNGQATGAVYGATSTYIKGSRFNAVDKTWNVYPNNNAYSGDTGSLFDVTNATAIGDNAIQLVNWGGSGYATNGSIFLFSGGNAPSSGTAPYLLKSTTTKGGQLAAVSYGASTFSHNCDYGNGLFAVTAANGTGIYTSPDAITWTSRGTNAQNITYLNNLWLASVGNTMWTSTNGTTWTSRTPTGLGGNGILGFAFGAGLFVLVAQGGYIATSPDGTTWTQRTTGTANNFTGVMYG